MVMFHADKAFLGKDLEIKKRRKTTQTAQQAYEATMADICNLIGWLECELEKTPEKIQWPHIGSLQKVKDDLLETLAFKSGLDIGTLKEALEDASVC